MTKQATKNTRKPINQGAKFALDMAPLLTFLLANFYGESLAEIFPVLQDLGGKIFIATAGLMIATTISLTITWLLERRIAKMMLATAIMVLVFGSITLYLKDETYLKIKVTIINVLFGTILLGVLFIRGKSILKALLDSSLQLDDEGWKKLTLRWGLWFFFLAFVNEVIWRNFSTDFWVLFKVWGIISMTIVFMLFQVSLLSKHGLPEEDAEENEKNA